MSGWHFQWGTMQIPINMKQSITAKHKKGTEANTHTGKKKIKKTKNEEKNYLAKQKTHHAFPT